MAAVASFIVLIMQDSLMKVLKVEFLVFSKSSLFVLVLNATVVVQTAPSLQ